MTNAGAKPKAAQKQMICVVFEHCPGPEGGKFLEVEDEQEHGLNVPWVKWRERTDGLWSLDIPMPDTDQEMLLELERLRARVAELEAAVVARDELLVAAQHDADVARPRAAQQDAEATRARETNARLEVDLGVARARVADLEAGLDELIDRRKRVHKLIPVGEGLGEVEDRLDQYVGRLRRDCEQLKALVAELVENGGSDD